MTDKVKKESLFDINRNAHLLMTAIYERMAQDGDAELTEDEVFKVDALNSKFHEKLNAWSFILKKDGLLDTDIAELKKEKDRIESQIKQLKDQKEKRLSSLNAIITDQGGEVNTDKHRFVATINRTNTVDVEKLTEDDLKLYAEASLKIGYSLYDKFPPKIKELFRLEKTNVNVSDLPDGHVAKIPKEVYTVKFLNPQKDKKVKNEKTKSKSEASKEKESVQVVQETNTKDIESDTPASGFISLESVNVEHVEYSENDVKGSENDAKANT